MTDPFTPSLNDFILKTMDEWKIAGLSIAVVDGEDVFSKGFGFATLPDTPATPQTIWYTGSTTKAFTTAILSYMINSGKYPVLDRGWQTPISSIIRDDFVTQDAWATNHLTLEDAASHRTGLSSNDNGILASWTIQDIVRNLRNFPLRAETRTEFKYNNECYATLSHVIETITGKWLGDVIKEIIWQPLNMNSTFLDLTQAEDAPEHLSTGYYWDKNKECYKPISNVPTEVVSGAGAVISSVLDYTKWIKCLLRKDAPLPEEVHNDIRRPRFVDNPNPEGGLDVSLYGLAWWRTSIYGKVVYFHSGSTVSHGALVYWLPDVNYGVVIMANYPNPSRTLIMRRLIEDKLGIPECERYDISKYSREAERKAEEDIQNAEKTLFPNKPKESKPPSVPLVELSGKYQAPGFGIYDFSLDDGNDADGKSKVLIAERNDLLWKTRITLQHVSGDFWIAFFAMIEGGGFTNTFEVAEFKFGVDGKPSGLEITFKDRVKANGGKVVFERVD